MKDEESRTPAPVRRVTIPAAVAPLLLQFPELDSRIWMLAVARFIVTAGFSVVMPFLAMHLAVERHVPVLQIGVLWTIVGVSGSIMQGVAGEVADRIGRRPVMIAAMLLRSLNLAGLGYAIGTDAPFAVVGALCVINGAMRAFYDPVASAVVASLASPDERVAAFSLHRVGSSLGWAAGPLVATLASSVPYSVLFYACAPLTLLAVIPAAIIPETRGERPPKKVRVADIVAFRRDRIFVRFLWATFAFYLMQTQMYHIMAIYAAKYLDLTRAQVGTLFTLNGIMVVLFQLPAVRFIRQVGTRGALVAGSLGYLVAYAACGQVTGYLALLPCVALITLCEIFSAPAQQAAVTALAPPHRVAAYSGVYGLIQGAAQTVGPILGTFLIATFRPSVAWMMLASLGLVAAWGYRPRPGGTVGQATLTPWR